MTTGTRRRAPTNWRFARDIATSGDVTAAGVLNTANSVGWTTAAGYGATGYFMDFGGVNSSAGTDGVEAIAGYPANGSGASSTGTNHTASTNASRPPSRQRRATICCCPFSFPKRIQFSLFTANR